MPVFKKISEEELKTNEPVVDGVVIHGLRLSPNKPLRTGRAKKVLDKLGISRKQHNEWVGMLLRDFIKLNKGITERFYAELIIENMEDIKAL